VGGVKERKVGNEENVFIKSKVCSLNLELGLNNSWKYYPNHKSKSQELQFFDEGQMCKCKYCSAVQM